MGTIDHDGANTCSDFLFNIGGAFMVIEMDGERMVPASCQFTGDCNDITDTGIAKSARRAGDDQRRA